MRKVVSLVCSMALAAAMPAAASDVIVEPVAIVRIQQEKAEIKAEELPDAVKTTLAGEAYKGWTIDKAYKITEENKPDIFEVALKKGEARASVQFDGEGNKIE